MNVMRCRDDDETKLGEIEDDLVFGLDDASLPLVRLDRPQNTTGKLVSSTEV